MRNAILPGCHALKLLEYAEECIGIFKTNPHSNFLDGYVLITKQLLCRLNPQAIQIVDKSDAGLILEIA